ncbi:Rho1 guanine nucleotide exchange factor 1 like protein [Verticillium longisporum]|uniref:Rho1 guanine nucleotide exchange factor 1 like protein n=1 Tax=Verticillium longisporum TaxID=100787 RepID=A0A8I3AXU7_VERLO|nr:Rho1 guanine nucleotide exchange factor 1 like protein [Verticillium longisporum]
MTSSSVPPQMMSQGRTQTMQSNMSGMPPSMQRQPPPRQPIPNQYGDRQPLSPRTRTMDGDASAGGVYPGQRSVSGGYQVSSPQSQYLQQQQQQRRYGGPPPPRPDSRGAPQGAAGARTAAQRFHQGGPAPSMMNDPYRSQSLASAPRQPQYQPPPSAYQQQAPANAFRHAPYNPNSSRTTAQGRVVPERHDDRSMSMTGGFPPQERDGQHSSYQTMSGRVIPNRRAPVELPTSNSVPNTGYSNGGYPPAPGSQTRTTSMVSSSADTQRTMSMASTITIPVTPADSDTTLGHRPSMSTKSVKSTDGERPPTGKIRAPLVYPAMLSRVAECFQHKIITGDRTKNELAYKSAFSGAEAVDVLSYIIRTTDRNLALLLGRALDAQKFFHDVTYEHRLRDSTSEMYQFRETLTDQPDDNPVNGQKNPVVHNVGDVFLEFVPQFEPFIWYGSKQMEAKHEFENEKSINPYFAKFVEEIERRKESRKLELNGYLTKPTTRLARYPLLLEAVLKHSEESNSDKEDLPKVLTVIRDLLSRVNRESGKAENRFHLKRLHEQLRFRPNERVELRLTEEGREIVFKSQLRKTPHDSSPANEITSYLFDHAVLLVRVKQAGKAEEIKAYRRPIPLELLAIREMDEVIPQQGVKRTSSSLLPLGGNNAKDGKKSEGWPITFRHLGKAGYELTLYAANQAGRDKWLQFIDKAQKQLRARADFFNTTVISSNYFVGANQINCVTPCDGGRKLIYGTDTGIYVSDRKNKDMMPKRVIETAVVTQIDILEEYGLLLVLTNKAVYSYAIAALDPTEPASSKRGKKIQSHCTFFKTGICLGRHLVCCVKSSALSTTIKVYEPTDAFNKGKKQKGFGKMFAGQDELKPFKEFYIPTESSSVHFLKSKLCVACARGFEVVSLETLETQSLLDQADTSLDFVARKESVKPIHIERLNGEFLLNYSEFSFFVNRNGWRARPEWRIDWEGAPHSFALSYPWILAFEANFIELRNIENGGVHIVPHKNIRMLHSSTHEILFAYEDEKGEDVVEALDFWKNNRRSELPPPQSI